MEWLLGSGVLAWVKDVLSKRQPTVQINLAPGSTYNDVRGAKGEFHVHLDGKAEVISSKPIRIAEVGMAAFSDPPNVSLTVEAVDPDDR